MTALGYFDKLLLMKFKSILSLVGLSTTLISSHLGASVVVTFAEVGNDVVATTSGSIAAGWTNTGGLVLSQSGASYLSASSLRGIPSAGGVRFTAASNHWTLNNTLTGFTFSDGIVTGDAFGYSSTNNFYAPLGTSVGDAFTPNTTITWANETFASLGIDTTLSSTPIVLFTLDNGSTISGVAVPEPSMAVLLLGAAAGAYILMRRKRIG